MIREYKYGELKVGISERFEVTITEDMMAAFMAITRDVNPLHADISYAISRGYKNKVVYGMLTASFYSTLVGMYLPGKNGLLQEVDVLFSRPVYAGDVLAVHGEISFLNDAYHQVEIKASITNRDGLKVSRAKIKAGVYE